MSTIVWGGQILSKIYPIGHESDR